MPVFLLDLAVPRDIEAEVGELEDAYLYTVDDMMDIVQSGKDARKKAAAAAERMVEEKVSEFIRLQKTVKAFRLSAPCATKANVRAAKYWKMP